MKCFLLPCISLIGLILSTSVFAEGWENELLKKNAAIQSIETPKSVFVHTDRSAYYGGEEMWFSAFLNELHKSGLNESEQVLYVELCNHLGERILKRAYHLKAGRAQGNILL